MKLKYLFLVIFFNLGFNTFGQVGIGTTSPHSSASLDISSTNSGLLIPRIALLNATDTSTITTPETSLLVYNTGFIPNGYYYWNGSQWVQLAVSSNNNWLLTGNSGTSSATNFVGTTDNVDLVFKRNNFRAGFIGDPTYNISTFNSNNGNTSFGANSLVNPTTDVALQTGVRNSAFGVNVMPGLTTGQRNTGIGDFALFSTTTGSENTALGAGALYSNTTASSNVAVGRNALTSNNANNNTAVGFASLRQNTLGTNNTAIGYESLRNVTGSGNVGLGYQAGRLETGSNKLYIENSNANADNALVYGEFDNNIVRVNGTLQISNPANAPGYALPNVRGTAGQILETNGLGATNWVTPATSNNSLIRTNLLANQVVSATGWHKILFDTILFDTNSEFNTASNRFTATKAGYYEINSGLHTFNKNDPEYYGIAVYKNGVEYQETAAHHYGDKLISRTINCLIYLDVADYVEIYFFNGNAPTTIDAYSGKTYFEVKQVR